MDKNNIKDYKELQSYFRKRIHPYVEDSRTRVYWFNKDAMAVGVEPADYIHYWDSIAHYDDLKIVNNKIIFSSYDQLYLDCGSATNLIGTPTWCALNTWRNIYKFDPVAAGVE